MQPPHYERHIAIHGPTGSGQTVCLRYFLDILFAPEKNKERQYIVIDGKWIEFSYLRKKDLPNVIVMTPEEPRYLVPVLVDTLERLEEKETYVFIDALFMGENTSAEKEQFEELLTKSHLTFFITGAERKLEGFKHLYLKDRAEF